MKPVIIIAIIFFSLIVPTVSNAYAETLTTKLWFITNNENGCSIWNELSLDFYQSVTAQYLPMYDMHGTLIDGKCVRDIDVVNDYDEFIKARQSVDLPIIVLDHTVGTWQLKTLQNELGHYWLVDDERFGIVFGSFARFTVEDKESAWTLSHEISHYVAHYRGVSFSDNADWVHEVDTKYDNCNDIQQCTELWTTVTSPAGQLIPVMKPIKEIKNFEPTSVTPIPAPITPTPSNDKVIFAFPEEKLVVKQDNPVSVKGFAMVGLGENNYLPYAKLSLKKYPEGTTIKTTTSDSFGHFIFDLTGVKNIETYDRDSGISTWNMYVEFVGDSKNKSAKSQTIRLTVVGLAESSIFEKIFPKDDVSTPEPSTPTSTKDVKKLEIPNWIRNTAKWFGEGAIGESDFTSALQYMIKNGIMKIPNLPDHSTNLSEYKVPDWIKNNALWWSEGKISDDDFVKGLHFLVDKGIIKLD